MEPEPVVEEPVVEPEPVIEPVIEPVPEPVVEPVPEPVVEPVPETVVEEPIVEEPVVEPVPEPVQEVTVSVEIDYTTIIIKPTKVTLNNYSPAQQKLINTLNNAVSKGQSLESKVSQETLNLFTWAGLKTKHFLNALLEMEDARYLEISNWEGSSIFSTICGNNANVTMIYPSNGKENMISDNLATYKGNNNVNLIVENYFTHNASSLPKFNIFMYDADWSEESQREALRYYYNNMEDTFIYIADDWNWHSVQKGTIRAIQDLNLTILEEFECLMTSDGSHTNMDLAKSDWWNGIYVAVLQKN